MAPTPLSFIPPVPSWGTGPYGPPKALGLRVEGSSVSDPTVCFELVVRLLGPYAAEDSGLASFTVFDDSDGFPKQTVTEQGAVLDTDSLLEWWGRGKSSSAMLETGRIRCQLHTFGDGKLVTVWLTLSEPSGDEIRFFSLRLAAVIAGMPGWHALIGLGEGWMTPSSPGPEGTTVLGYGPLLVADAKDLDVDQVNTSLVKLTDLDDGRLLMETRDEADLEAAAIEMRRICWPSWGYRYAPAAMDGSLFFEGGWSPISMMGLLSVERFIHKKIRRLLRCIVEGREVDVIADPGVALLRRPADDMSQHLVDIDRLVGAWRRGATAVTPPEYVPASGLVDCVVELGEAEVVLRYGACSAGALTVLEETIERWPRIFGTETPGPLRWHRIEP